MKAFKSVWKRLKAFERAKTILTHHDNIFTKTKLIKGNFFKSWLAFKKFFWTFPLIKSIFWKISFRNFGLYFETLGVCLIFTSNNLSISNGKVLSIDMVGYILSGCSGETSKDRISKLDFFLIEFFANLHFKLLNNY